MNKPSERSAAIRSRHLPRSQNVKPNASSGVSFGFFGSAASAFFFACCSTWFFRSSSFFWAAACSCGSFEFRPFAISSAFLRSSGLSVLSSFSPAACRSFGFPQPGLPSRRGRVRIGTYTAVKSAKAANHSAAEITMSAT